MPLSEMKWVKRCAEFKDKEDRRLMPRGTRGIYALLKYRPRARKYDVVYVWMAGGAKGSIRGRLRSHAQRKGNLWTHFSIFEVWENVYEKEVAELEGLFRHIYRCDSRANKLNRQKSFKKLGRIRQNDFSKWPRRDGHRPRSS